MNKKVLIGIVCGAVVLTVVLALVLLRGGGGSRGASEVVANAYLSLPDDQLQVMRVQKAGWVDDNDSDPQLREYVRRAKADLAMIDAELDRRGIDPGSIDPSLVERVEFTEVSAGATDSP